MALILSITVFLAGGLQSALTGILTGMLNHTMLDELAALGPFFAVGSHPPGASPVAPWRPVSELTDPTGAAGPAGPLRERMAAVRAALAASAPAGRGSRAVDEVEPRVAASALHLGLVARLVAPALGSAVLRDPVDMRPGGLWWQDQIGGPVPLSVPAPSSEPLSVPAGGGERLGPGEWGGWLIDETVAPVTTAIARLVPLSDRVLWGNVASAINAAAAQVARQRPDLAGDAWQVAADLFGSPRLSRERHRPGPGFRRSSCCLFYRLAPGSPSAICGDCVLGDRLYAWAAMTTESGGPHGQASVLEPATVTSLACRDMRQTERLVDTGEVRLRVLDQGDGPAVVLCHGFPGLAHSWRNQLPVLAAAGFRAIAPDMRGYGGSDRPAEPSAYGRAHTAADMAGLLDALGIEDAVFVGHDFGAGLTWDLPQWAPGRVRALIQLGLPRFPASPVRPSEAFAMLAASHFLHLHYFQEPGVADAELDGDPTEFLSRVYWALSGDARYADIWRHPSEGNGYLDVLPEAPPLPWPWMSKEDFSVYADTFAQTGFTGSLNWYRAADAVWREKQDRPDELITLPVLFVGGNRDPVLEPAFAGPDAFATTRTTVPGLTGVHLIPGAGHFVQMEAAGEVSRLMLDFLRQLFPGRRS